jgi:hypothetical protein
MLTGSCLCRAVRYEIDGALKRITHCHCSMCRKQHGAAFATYAPLRRARFRLVAGQDALVSYASSEKVRREFCKHCGSSMFWLTSEWPDVIDVALGTLDDDPVGRPEAHIFVASKAPWVEIEDELPQYPEGRPGT